MGVTSQLPGREFKAKNRCPPAENENIECQVHVIQLILVYVCMCEVFVVCVKCEECVECV